MHKNLMIPSNHVVQTLMVKGWRIRPDVYHKPFTLCKLISKCRTFATYIVASCQCALQTQWFSIETLSFESPRLPPLIIMKWCLQRNNESFSIMASPDLKVKHGRICVLSLSTFCESKKIVYCLLEEMDNASHTYLVHWDDESWVSISLRGMGN